jgi:hypothetical protein
MKNNVRQAGRLLKRREALGFLRAAGAAVLVISIPKRFSSTQAQSNQSSQAVPTPKSSTLPGCIVRPQQTEGPYFVDEKLNRSDIRSDPSNGSIKPVYPSQGRSLIFGTVMRWVFTQMSAIAALIPWGKSFSGAIK